MGYIEVYHQEDVLKLRDGLEVLERFVDNSELYELQMWLYGMCTDPTILKVAKEALIPNAEKYWTDDGSSLLEEDMELTEIAIAFRLSADNINILYGSGFPLDDLDFAYQSGEGEGGRTSNFKFAGKSSVKLKINKLTTLAFANDDYELKGFLKDKGTGAVLKLPVARSEEATVEEPVQSEIPKQTSLKVSNLLKDIVEDFLG